MAGVRGRSGPPGNLNAVKNGYQSWRRRRALPAACAHVNALVAAEERDLMQDKGGAEGVTAAERALIRDAGTAYGLILLALEEARARGCIALTKDGQWDLMPGLQRVRGLLDSRRMTLVALGLGRRARAIEVPSLAEIQSRYEDPT